MNELLLRLGNKLNDRFIWKQYSKKCRKQGLRQSKLLVSFDCDTPEDAEIVLDVHNKLNLIGVKVAYAVPGELIDKHPVIYKQLLQKGAEFLNHGGRSHTFFNTEKNRYESNFFYDQQTVDVLKEDIQLGHRILKKTLNVEAVGWRTPHFGTFQSYEQFSFLYNVLSSLGYRYSSSRLPWFAYARGPAAVDQPSGIVELPVTGAPEYPFSILDSWAYFAAPDRTKTPEDYAAQCASLASIAASMPILVNIYADPSHIWDKPEFFDGIQKVKNAAESIRFSDIVQGLK